MTESTPLWQTRTAYLQC